MKLILFILVYPFLWLISILPFPILYLFSDGMYVLVYHIIGYRKKVVRENLALALPDLSVIERLSIEKKSYKHLCDMFLEMIKTMTVSSKEINKRFVFTNPKTYQDLEKTNKSIALMLSHYASYEWSFSINKIVNIKTYGIYKKINNPYFDKLAHKIRSRFNLGLITNKEAIPTIIENTKNGIIATYGFASDQSPKREAVYWKDFMGIEVPVHTGAEMLSKRYNMNVVFLKTKKIKRGFYETTFEILSENAKEVPDYEITDKFLKLVENQILEAPEFYLWTHRRWKHRK
jgi:Kdo2-lipid IVA lauroyltransferase/acyltransferase